MGFCCKCRKWVDLTGGYFVPKQGFTCVECAEKEGYYDEERENEG